MYSQLTGSDVVNDPTLGSGNWDTSDFSADLKRTFDYVDFYGVYLGKRDVPEPMSLLLVAGGLAGLGLAGKKKRA